MSPTLGTVGHWSKSAWRSWMGSGEPGNSEGWDLFPDPCQLFQLVRALPTILIWSSSLTLTSRYSKCVGMTPSILSCITLHPSWVVQALKAGHICNTVGTLSHGCAIKDNRIRRLVLLRASHKVRLAQTIGSLLRKSHKKVVCLSSMERQSLYTFFNVSTYSY